MKALTIQQPWAWLICSGIKPIENRTWRTTHRGELAIHAAKRPTWLRRLDASWPRWRHTSWGGHVPPDDQLTLGGIVGNARLIDCVRIDDLHTDHPQLRCHRDLIAGPWCWVLTEPVALEVPIMCPGRLSLWETPNRPESPL